jgi:hypothetical protein
MTQTTTKPATREQLRVLIKETVWRHKGLDSEQRADAHVLVDMLTEELATALKLA